jgi:predicted nucleic acid-binding protein
MAMKRGKLLRVYVDTSVFGGVFDAEFARASQRFFDKIHRGVFHPVISALVADEMADAPPRVQSFYRRVARTAEMWPVDEPALTLRDAYLEAGIVTEQWAADALHVAVATVSACALIVSWNFRHIVNFRRIPLYNAVNRKAGYKEIGIFTPQEVIEDEDETL